jgi:hypothetical protein
VLNQSTYSRQHLWIIAASVLLIQLALLGFSFPLSELLSGKFPWHIDGPYHLYQIELGRALLKQGVLTGIDPYFGAGHLGGVTYNASARLPVLVAGLLPNSVSSAVLYSVYVLLSALIAPLAVVGMARVLRWPLLHTALAAMAGLAYWWIGALRWYHTAGMVSFVCASYLGALYGAWTWSICSREPTTRMTASVVLAGILGGAGIWFHPLFGLLVAPWFLAFLVVNWKEVQWNVMWMRAVPIAIIALALNLPWILAMLGSPNLASQTPYQKSVGIGVALWPLVGKWGHGGMGSFLNPISVTICIVGVFVLHRAVRKRILPFLGVATFLLLFAAFGAASPKIGIVQPNRFLAPAFLFYGLGAAYVLGDAILRLRLFGRRELQIAATAAALLVGLYTANEIRREVTPGPHGHYGVGRPELTSPPVQFVQLESWIRANTREDGRILFETSLGRIHGGGHIAGMLALATGREFVGAPYPYALPESSFWDNTGFGEPIGKLTAEELLHRFDYYNVGWIIAHSPALIALAEKATYAQPVAQFGNVRIFKIQRPLSYFASGTGNIAARGFNKIEIDGAQGSELILRYRWVPGLVSTPAAKLEPVEAEAGMPALIRVISPPAHFTISVGRIGTQN